MWRAIAGVLGALLLGVFFAPGSADARPKISPAFAAEVEASIRSGRPANLMVVFDDDAAQQDARRLQTESLIPPDRAALRAYKARAFATLKSNFAKGYSTAQLEFVRDYTHLPIALLRAKSEATLRRLMDDPSVRGIARDEILQRQLAQSLPLIQQPAVAAAGQRGQGTTVVVLDTGVDFTRPEFGSCTNPGFPSGCRVAYAADIAPEDGMRDDPLDLPNGKVPHGTNVSAIVAAVAPGTRLAVLDVFGPLGALVSDAVAGIDWAIDNQSTYNIVAINMSLGSPSTFANPITDPADPFKSAIDNARAAGILTVAASGNNGSPTSISSPAAVDTAISVGAVYDSAFGSAFTSICGPEVTAADKVACFSNGSNFLTLLAPGAGIQAGGVTLSGTSQAAPHVAGGVAVLRAAFPSEPLDLTVARLRNGVLVTDPRNGFSKPRLDLALATVGPDTSPAPFGFSPVSDAPLGALAVSDAITVTGINLLTPISVAGGEYSVNGGPFSALPAEVRSGDIVRVRLVSASTYATPREAILTVGDFSAAFQATTLAPPLSFGPSTLNYYEPTLPLGTNSGRRQTEITNAGSSPVTIFGISVLGNSAAEFAQTNNCGVLQPTGTCTVEITFTPSAPGIRVSQLALVTDLPADPGRIGLIGNRGAGVHTDFDGNGRDDILWRHLTSGSNSIWLMDGANRVSDGPRGGPITGVPDLNWEVAGVGDFNSDGKADILWRHAATGNNSIWLMDGASRIGGGPIPAVPDPVNWRIAGVGDFDGDGRADILWRHAASGGNSIWLMDGAIRLGGGPIAAVPDTDWRIARIGDFNGDGRADILWRHARQGSNSIWLMNGANRVGGGPIIAVPDLGWQIAGVGDLNADGRADIIWRHATTGNNSTWLMDGTARIGGGPIAPLPGSSWKIEQATDFTGDGKADILWRNLLTGANGMWITDDALDLPLDPVPELSWTIAP